MDHVSDIGKSLRLARVLSPDSGCIIVPIDHSIEAYFEELENPRRLVEQFANAGADAVLLRRGSLSKVQDLIAGKMGVVFRMSGATGTSTDSSDQIITSSISEAMRVGADCVVHTVVLGHPHENEMFRAFGILADEARNLGMPLMGEIALADGLKENATEAFRLGARSLSEEGADVIKAYLPKNENDFAKIIKNSLVPVVAAGGAKMSTPMQFLEFVQAVMKAGAKGTCIGRNIWQYSNPSKMITAMSAIIKNGETAEKAARLL